MSEKIATRDAYGKTLAELGDTNADIVVLDADLSCSTKTNIFGQKFPERFFNLGVAEQNMLGWAAGLAAANKVPFASTFAVFATGRAYDQIRNSIAVPNLNVKIAATHAGLSVGPDGASNQAIEDIALMRILPNFTVVVPADGPQASLATKAIYKHNGPVYLRLGRPKVPLLEKILTFEIGKAQILRPGKDATLVACGTMVWEALNAAEELAKENLEIQVINMHTLKPLDEEIILKAAKETRALLTIEEHTIIGGLGSATAEVLAENNIALPFKRIGIEDKFGESGEPDELLSKFGLKSASIVKQVKNLLA